MPISSQNASRRDFMTAGAQSVTGLMAAALASQAAAADKKATPGPAPEAAAGFDPRAKLRAISKNAKQLWTVVYVDPTKPEEVVERDVEASFEGGADAVVLEIGKSPAPLIRAVAHVRKKYPGAKVGCNYLGDDTDPYGYINGFQISKDHGLDIIWTDFCGVDLVKEVPEVSMHTIDKARPDRAFYCSGIHMKYGTLLDPNKTIEHSALQAMGWVDGVIITGPRTGVPTDPDRARRARATVGTYPLGAASGVSVENFQSIRDYVDYCLVNTSISDPDHRIIMKKVRELRKVMV
jgi:hypothetical protein